MKKSEAVCRYAVNSSPFGRSADYVRIQREALAPSRTHPRKNKNKSCLSKDGSVSLLSLTIRIVLGQAERLREAPAGIRSSPTITYFGTRDGAGNETIRDFARGDGRSVSAYRSRMRDTSAGSMSAAAAIRSRGREEP